MLVAVVPRTQILPSWSVAQRSPEGRPLQTLPRRKRRQRRSDLPAATTHVPRLLGLLLFLSSPARCPSASPSPSLPRPFRCSPAPPPAPRRAPPPSPPPAAAAPSVDSPLLASRYRGRLRCASGARRCLTRTLSGAPRRVSQFTPCWECMEWPMLSEGSKIDKGTLPITR